MTFKDERDERTIKYVGEAKLDNGSTDWNKAFSQMNFRNGANWALTSELVRQMAEALVNCERYLQWNSCDLSTNDKTTQRLKEQIDECNNVLAAYQAAIKEIEGEK